ncbi:MAG TPA: ABC transporter permease [Thermoanaerobaculia bacterium]|nr:ABC transporter permease [Thermoanaerobaculia bacterium]
MTRFLLRRLAASVLLLLLVVTIAFFILRLIPGDPIHLFEGQRLTLEQQQRLKTIYGLDRPLLEQYAVWLSAVALHGDWGTSLTQQRPVASALLEALPATAILATAALTVEFAAALLLGVAAARRRRSAVDHAIRVGTLLLSSQPVFWVGLMAILLFAYVWPVLPASHMHSVDADLMGPAGWLWDLLRHLTLPALVLGLANSGATARFVRASLIEVMGQDYIRAARAKGLSELRVVWVHGLRNAAVPLIQIFALTLPALLSGSLITEVVFSWPGLGQLTFNSILTRDYPLILGATALSATLVVLGNLLADVLHAVVDPRARDA